MGRSRRLPELDESEGTPLGQAAAAVGGAIARNPVLVGGATAFIVALSYVSANALWYQPHFHSGAFFATRANNYVEPGPPADETTIRIERQSAVATPKPKPDPVVEQVQSILQSMNLYAGDVDGINGPNTRKAVEAYRKTMGMELSGDIDDALLEQLGAADTTAGIQPKAVPVKAVPVPAEPQPRAETVSVKLTDAESAKPDPMVQKIQAGLKAFGNDGMEIDGVIGAKTRAAIREFQSLFGLPVTGEPDQKLYAKMREVGLTN
jgi:peptidoglycan hydrolase-like protein with peptidoglycan-binding domain